MSALTNSSMSSDATTMVESSEDVPPDGSDKPHQHTSSKSPTTPRPSIPIPAPQPASWNTPTPGTPTSAPPTPGLNGPTTAPFSALSLTRPPPPIESSSSASTVVPAAKHVQKQNPDLLPPKVARSKSDVPTTTMGKVKRIFGAHGKEVPPHPGAAPGPGSVRPRRTSGTSQPQDGSKPPPHSGPPLAPIDVSRSRPGPPIKTPSAPSPNSHSLTDHTNATPTVASNNGHNTSVNANSRINNLSVPASPAGSPMTSNSPTESEESSHPRSRAVSISSKDGSKAKSTGGGGLGLSLTPLKDPRSRTGSKGAKDSEPIQTVMPGRTSRPPSISAGSDSGGRGFTLKDLLGSGTKLVRKTSISSRKSDASSDRGSHGEREDRGPGTAYSSSNAGSFSQKYGVCERVAIGKGATSVVKLAHKWDRSEEKLYAVKEFRKRRKNETEKEYIKKLTAEFCISSTLHHINIVETVDLVQDENQHWCEVMEFCPGGDLYAAIRKGGMSPTEVECCFKQMLQGVSYLHSQGVAHRDIKPENLFFNGKGHLKIGDYGASTVYRLPWQADIHMSTGLCGSEPYIAPEQFNRTPYDARLVDIWACGVVYYCLHFQELPWSVAKPSDPHFAAHIAACESSASNLLKEKEASSSGAAAATNGNSHNTASSTPNSIASPNLNSVSNAPPAISYLSPRACRPLLRRMLEPNPKLRCTIDDVMKNSWIQSIEVCTDPKSTPKHVHGSAQARALSVMGSVH